MRRLGSLGQTRTLVVVPGGGPFADAVRRADRRFGLDDTAAHWMAILAMDQYAHLLAQLAPAAVLVRGPGEIRARRLNVLAPAGWLRRADPLPHAWSVTSDSIAAWIARALVAGGLVLLKDVDGQLEDGARRPPRLRARVGRRRLAGVVDDYFARALGPRMRCWIVNGRRPERVTRLLETGRSVGTEVG
jgi:5-(aminomethyl)-3-furanmethanol phosphate kinase